MKIKSNDYIAEEAQKLLKGKWFGYFWKSVLMSCLTLIPPSIILMASLVGLGAFTVFWSPFVGELMNNNMEFIHFLFALPFPFNLIITLVAFFLIAVLIWILHLGVIATVMGFVTTAISRFHLYTAQQKPTEYFSHIGATVSKWGACISAYTRVLIKVTLGMMLLLIPGIIFALDYYLVPYLIANESNITGAEATHKSRELMYGHRKQVFWMMFKQQIFLTLSIFLLGLPIFYLAPHYFVEQAIFARDLIEAPESDALQADNAPETPQLNT